MGSKIFEQRLKNISPEIKILSGLLLDISDQINDYMKEKGINQAELAQKLGKKEAEISKWMSGSHNFTIRTIAKISAVLERPILTTLLYVDELEDRDKNYILEKLGESQLENLSKLKIPYFDMKEKPVLAEVMPFQKNITLQNMLIEPSNRKIFETYK